MNPRVVARVGGREQLHEVARLKHAHPPRPNLVVTVSPRLHEEEEADEHRVYEDDEVRVRRQREGEGERRARRDDGPVGRRVQTVAPGVRARDLAAVEVNHRRAELGSGRRGACDARRLRGGRGVLGRDGLVYGCGLGRVGRRRGARRRQRSLAVDGRLLARPGAKVCLHLNSFSPPGARGGARARLAFDDSTRRPFVKAKVGREMTSDG